MVITWALITAAILAVPFGIWWILDRAVLLLPREYRQEIDEAIALGE